MPFLAKANDSLFRSQWKITSSHCPINVRRHGANGFSSGLSIPSCPYYIYNFFLFSFLFLFLPASQSLYFQLYIFMWFFSPQSPGSLLRLPTSETSSHSGERNLEIHLWTVKMTNFSQLFGYKIQLSGLEWPLSKENWLDWDVSIREAEPIKINHSHPLGKWH